MRFIIENDNDKWGDEYDVVEEVDDDVEEAEDDREYDFHDDNGDDDDDGDDANNDDDYIGHFLNNSSTNFPTFSSQWRLLCCLSLCSFLA